MSSFSVGPDSSENRLKADDLKLDLIGHLPLSDRFGLSAGVGVARVYTRSDAHLGSGATSQTTGISAINTLSVGGDYHF